MPVLIPCGLRGFPENRGLGGIGWGPANQAAFETIPLAGEVIPRMEGRRSAATKPSPLAPLVFYFLISFSICSACLNVYIVFSGPGPGRGAGKTRGRREKSVPAKVLSRNLFQFCLFESGFVDIGQKDLSNDFLLARLTLRFGTSLVVSPPLTWNTAPRMPVVHSRFGMLVSHGQYRGVAVSPPTP